jgi:hypothetical protein
VKNCQTTQPAGLVAPLKNQCGLPAIRAVNKQLLLKLPAEKAEHATLYNGAIDPEPTGSALHSRPLTKSIIHAFASRCLG